MSGEGLDGHNELRVERMQQELRILKEGRTTMEMGRYLFISRRESTFFNTGIVLDIFMPSGNIPF